MKTRGFRFGYERPHLLQSKQLVYAQLFLQMFYIMNRCFVFMTSSFSLRPMLLLWYLRQLNKPARVTLYLDKKCVLLPLVEPNTPSTTNNIIVCFRHTKDNTWNVPEKKAMLKFGLMLDSETFLVGTKALSLNRSMNSWYWNLWRPDYKTRPRILAFLSLFHFKLIIAIVLLTRQDAIKTACHSWCEKMFGLQPNL